MHRHTRGGPVLEEKDLPSLETVAWSGHINAQCRTPDSSSRTACSCVCGEYTVRAFQFIDERAWSARQPSLFVSLAGTQRAQRVRETVLPANVYVIAQRLR